MQKQRQERDWCMDVVITTESGVGPCGGLDITLRLKENSG